ncbi:hypothetical protein QCN27_13960 [Cereibacter sp. SYSU M97828]|nr:hypothetical protein [Cereibacter flavus]
MVAGSEKLDEDGPVLGAYYNDLPLGLWETAEGRVLRISEMSDEHLSNAAEHAASHNWSKKVIELRDEISGRDISIGGCQDIFE